MCYAPRSTVVHRHTRCERDRTSREVAACTVYDGNVTTATKGKLSSRAERVEHADCAGMARESAHHVLSVTVLQVLLNEYPYRIDCVRSPLTPSVSQFAVSMLNNPVLVMDIPVVSYERDRTSSQVVASTTYIR